MKKHYEAPSLIIMKIDTSNQLLGASDPIVNPTGPGVSTDHGTSAAPPKYSPWTDDEEE